MNEIESVHSPVARAVASESQEKPRDRSHRYIVPPNESNRKGGALTHPHRVSQRYMGQALACSPLSSSSRGGWRFIAVPVDISKSNTAYHSPLVSPQELNAVSFRS